MSRLFAAILLAFASFANAAPVIVREAGKPATLTFPSGNVAELKLNRNAALTVPVEFKVSENSCRSDVGQKFVVNFPLRADRLTYIWTKNSDPAKIGTPLKVKGTEFPYSATFIIANGFRSRFPDVVGDLQQDQFEKGDLSFVPGLEGPFKPFTIAEWFAENMTTNPETGISENRITSSILDVEVDGEGKIQSFNDESTGLDNQFFLVGDVVTWIVNTPQGVCQISSKADLAAAIKTVMRYIQTLPNTYVAYNWKSDGLTTMIDERPEASLLRGMILETADE